MAERPARGAQLQRECVHIVIQRFALVQLKTPLYALAEILHPGVVSLVKVVEQWTFHDVGNRATGSIQRPTSAKCRGSPGSQDTGNLLLSLRSLRFAGRRFLRSKSR